MRIIDTHCHLYSEEYISDIDTVIRTAKREGVEKFYLPAINSSAIEAMIGLEARFPGECIAMMGLHPCYVKEGYEAELEIISGWLKQRKFAAVGEIGLDYYWDRTFAVQQQEAFRYQIKEALHYDLPIVIHTRNAMEETIDIVKEYVPNGIKGIFHCFSGSYENAKEIINAGFYLGIGGVLTYKNAGLAEVLSTIDLKHIVLETDAPYLSPVPYRGKRNEPAYIPYVVKKLAEINNCSVEEIADTTTKNAEKIFGI